jgi:protein involved in polysaccharide export with SLBB domain
VSNEPELSKTVTVATDGKIGLPLLTGVPADGLTVPELQRILEGRYARFVKNPVVEVKIR